MTDVAIVGAGAAGLGAACALQEAGTGAGTGTVTLFEARDAVGGRARTRRRDGCVYDYGANYLKDGDQRVSRLVRGLGGDLLDVEEPVWTFDAEGRVSEGRDGDDHKWTYREGLATLARRLLARSGATVELGVAVTDLRPASVSGTGGDRDRGGGTPTDDGDRSGDGDRTDIGGGNRPGAEWTLTGVDAAGVERNLGRFDAVVLTPPAPLTGALLADSSWRDPLADDLAAAAGAVGYRTVLSVALHYPFRIDRPYYALVDIGRDHALGWVSREELKPGHVPDGETLLIVQMAPDWSRERYDNPPRAVASAAATHAADLLGEERLADPDWFDLGRFRHALADDALDPAVAARARDRGLFPAGDWVAGEARVHAALASGLDAGDRVVDRIG